MSDTWSSDVRVSMPEPAEGDQRVPMDGFVFTEKGLFVDIDEVQHGVLSTPSFAPETGLKVAVEWGDEFIEDTLVIEEHF